MMRYVQGAQLRLAVYEQGDPAAPTVVLVHGYPDTHAMWESVVPRLAEAYHVVRYDVRGAGASDTPRATAAYRLEWLTRDLHAVIDAVSPDAPVHLVGHDWGAIQSWEPVTEPGAERRIASYTAIAGVCLDHVGHWIRERTDSWPGRRQLLRQLLHSWYVGAFHLPVAAPAVWRFGLARRWHRVLRRLEDVPARPGHPAPTLAADASHGVRLYRANVLPRLLHPRQRYAHLPVQVIQPTGDHYLLPHFQEGLERWVPDLTLRLVDAKHWLPLIQPDTVADMVTEFVERIDRRVR
ncbi:MAG: alpha/beta fold hydrolase [Micromonosporaceae bacterium]